MKRVLITGGNRGIGKATVERLMAEKQYDVTFTFRSRENESFALARHLENMHPSKIRAIQLDLTQFDDTEKKLANEIAEQGAFDIVIHNAATTADTPLYFMERNQWQSVIDVSMNSFFIINKLCLPHMTKNRWGRIVSLVSVSGEAGNRGQCNYAAAKGAMIAATKSLAREMGSRGILCNCVSPGIIETEMTEGLPADELKKMIPVGRYGRPEEVASAIRFLVSDEASYINGEVLRVNGGFYT